MGLKKVGGLWLRKTKTGESFMAGEIEFVDDSKLSIMVFKNKYKKPDNKQPDYTISVKTDEEEGQGQGSAPPDNRLRDPYTGGNYPPPPEPPPYDPNNDIPF